MISAVVSNFNGARYLPRLIDSLKRQNGVEVEIIIVDRNSRDESAEILARYPEIVVVSEPPESGLVSGYAAGMSRARGDRVFFSNEDMWFDPDCLDRLSRAIDVQAGIAASDPWQWTYDGTNWLHGGVRFRPTRWSMNGPHPFRRADFTVDLKHGEAVPFACAGAFMIDRRVFEEVGGWDGEFFLDQEDVDLFIRLWQRGFRCVTVPEAKVFHDVGASNTQQLQGGQKVSKRRYISSRSSCSIIAIKYFSWSSLWMSATTLLAGAANNLRKGRFAMAQWDALAFKEVVRRAPNAARFRRQNAELNATRPGERFFDQSEFSSGLEP